MVVLCNPDETEEMFLFVCCFCLKHNTPITVIINLTAHHFKFYRTITAQAAHILMAFNLFTNYKIKDKLKTTCSSVIVSETNCLCIPTINNAKKNNYQTF